MLRCDSPAVAGDGLVPLSVSLNGNLNSDALEHGNTTFAYFDGSAVKISTLSPAHGPVYGGTAVTLSGSGFAVYGTLKDLVAVDVYGLGSAKELDVASGLACGGVAGAIGQTVAYPFDVCRRRLQVSGWQGAAALADKVFDSIAAQDLYILTHSDSAGRIRARTEMIINGAAPDYDHMFPWTGGGGRQQQAGSSKL